MTKPQHWDYEIKITGRIKCEVCGDTEDAKLALRHELAPIPLGEILAKVEIIYVRPTDD